MNNRIIKFRAYDPQTKEMFLNLDWDKKTAIFFDVKDSCLSVTRSNPETGDTYSLIPQQFTGLKDNSGVDIYEGDIVQYRVAEQGKESKNYIRKEVVQFYCGAFKVGPGALSEWSHENGLVEGKLKGRHYIGFGQEDIYMIDFDLEVIGNVYQNPELLNL